MRGADEGRGRAAKNVGELVPGDIITQDGVKFTVKVIANLPNGKTAILFEDMPATEENMAAYGKLLKLMLETNKEMEEDA